jgi:hypothetical protein
MEILEHPILQIVLADNQARSMDNEDGARCDLQIRNVLPVVSRNRSCRDYLLKLI